MTTNELLLQMSDFPKPFCPCQGQILIARVHHIYDGDSFRITAFDKERQIENQMITLPCRLLGIDTPEMRSPKGSQEKKLALLAKERVIDLCGKGLVEVKVGRLDKYGRSLVNVKLSDGSDLALKLISENLGVPYAGGTKNTNWEEFALQRGKNIMPSPPAPKIN